MALMALMALGRSGLQNFWGTFGEWMHGLATGLHPYACAAKALARGSEGESESRRWAASEKKLPAPPSIALRMVAKMAQTYALLALGVPCSNCAH